MIATKPSFSYPNEHMHGERFMHKSKQNKAEDDELGIFGAEKYFKGVLDEEVRGTPNNHAHCGSNRPQETHEIPCSITKPTTPSSVRSESSWNSRIALLVSNGPNGNNHSKKTGVKSLLACLGCSCNDKGSVKIIEVKQRVKGGDSGRRTKSLSSKRASGDVNIKREDCFTFPVLNPSMADVKNTEAPVVKQEGEHIMKKSVSLERKLTMLNWDGEQNDTGSDASSDLFELESFSTNRYEPSEASVDWSVVTASVADFSTPRNSAVSRNMKGSGILSGCKSLAAVRISGDMTHDGDKAEDTVSPARRDWCNRLDSTTRVAKIQADTKLICAGSGLRTSQNGFGIACQVHRTRSTMHHHTTCT